MKLNENTKKALINTINDQGFVLEHRLYSLLRRHFAAHQPRRGDVVFFNDIRKEFDSTLETGLGNFIFECKRSIFDYFFLAPADYPSGIHIIKHVVNSSGKSLGIHTVNAFPTWKIKTCADCVEVALDSKGNLSTKKYDKGRQFGEEYALTSSRDDYIRSKIKQVLSNTEAFIWKKMGLDSNTPDLIKTAGNIFFPVIVTNANLFYLRYSDDDVSGNGSLTNTSDPIPVKYIAYNFPENMRWGDRLQDVEYLVEEELGHPSKKYRGSHIKSVFIVNINYIEEFVNTFTQTTLGTSDEIEASSGIDTKGIFVTQTV